jgi:hypothetical protein
MLALMVGLGAERPDRNDSHWQPFHDVHGVSGHTFIGAIPFLTAAEMTDKVYLQIPLVLGSLAEGWSRLDRDKHYFSQAALGWWLALLATRSVNATQNDRRPVSIAPTWLEDGPGVVLQVRY